MTNIAVIDIYDAITGSNGDFCRICFHTSSTRKLVKPVAMTRFLNILSDCTLSKKQLQVCYICEGLAASVMRFCEVVKLAASLEELFSWIDSKNQRALVLKHLNTKNLFTSNRTCKRAKKCEDALRKAQSCSPFSITRTNTLIVSSGKVDSPLVVNNTHSSSQVTTPTVNGCMTNCSSWLVSPNSLPAPPATAVPLIANGSNNPTRNGNKLPPPPATMPLVVNNIKAKNAANSADNVRIPPSRTVAPPTVAKTAKAKKTANSTDTANGDDELPPARGIQVMIVPEGVRVLDKQTNGYVLHPMVNGTDGNIYVPSLKLKLLENKILQSVSDDVIALYTKTPAPKDRPYRPRRPRNALIENNTGDERAEANTLTVNRVEVVTMEDLNIVLNMDSEDSVASNKRLSDPLSLDSECVSESPKRVKSAAILKPVLSTGRVDWEDKIPMDVISFMNATDPNPSERIMQPTVPTPPTAGMGVITNVRSVDQFEEEVEIVENIECIDLC